MKPEEIGVKKNLLDGNIKIYTNNRNENIIKGDENYVSIAAASIIAKVTRDKIMNQVWGSEVLVGDRTIDVHIRKLREKFGNEYFKTIKGVGYKFEVN